MDANYLRPEHELVLQAAFLRGDPAIRAYAKWKSLVPFDDIDYESYRLLPLLYDNLQAMEIEDELTPRLRGIYRRTWYANQLARQQYRDALLALQTAAHDFQLIGGNLAISQLRDGIVIYPVDDVELLIRPGQVKSVEEILTGLGWQIVSRAADAVIYCKENGLYIGMHDRIVHGLSPAERLSVDQRHWNSSHEISSQGLTIFMLDPADQILFWLEYGLAGHGWPTLRWLTHMWLILTNAKDLNWDYVISQSRRRNQSLYLAELLSFLGSKLGLVISDHVLAELRRPASDDQENIQTNLALRSSQEYVRFVRKAARKLSVEFRRVRKVLAGGDN
ncbi:MAG: nucleotidyltransferase family protein [Caldilineales bacterium]|nr:nucleotidyltransferase family protein [Caldilineales bacterium]